LVKVERERKKREVLEKKERLYYGE